MLCSSLAESVYACTALAVVAPSSQSEEISGCLFMNRVHGCHEISFTVVRSVQLQRVSFTGSGTDKRIVLTKVALSRVSCHMIFWKRAESYWACMWQANSRCKHHDFFRHDTC